MRLKKMMNERPNPSDYNSFNDYLQAVMDFNPTWVIKDTANDTIIMECVTLNDALVSLFELTQYEMAHGTYQRGKNRIEIKEENNEENTVTDNDTDYTE